ncbi:MAG: hypothetical protein ACE5PM_04540 [Candidatus Hydrothermarchaeales archaeon]
MKTSKRCPKCGSTKIKRGHQAHYPSTFISDKEFESNHFNAFPKSKDFELYMCTSCGYSEWYIKEKHLPRKELKIGELTSFSEQSDAKVKD